MAKTGFSGAIGALRGTGGRVAALACCSLLGACAQPGSSPSELLGLQKPAAAASTAGSTTAGATGSVTTGSTAAGATTDGRSELHKATEFWGKAYAQNPRDPQIALNYARNLKAMGEKPQALMVLQQAAAFNTSHRGIVAEYGRLALELNQVSLAQKLLEQADDPASPDWKVISARGTVLAKQGLYREAIPLYERALELAPDQASVLSNLALAHAMEGSPEKAEPLLKRAMAARGNDPRVTQNLALVLGLQGKYDEAKLAAGRDLPADRASANVDYVKSMVKLEPKPMAKVAPAKAAAELKGAAAEGASEVPAWSTHVAVAKR